MLPNRYLIATLFIAAMLLIVAIAQGGRSRKQGGVGQDPTALSMSLDSFETLAELRLEEGWAPRFIGARDPDQWAPWPFEGGFGTAWEPASPYLGDQGVALNGPGGRSEVALWRGLEWRRTRFDAPLVSARLDPSKGNRLLVTVQLGAERFETRLLEIPEGRVLWAVDSGAWSRFSWDGRAVLVGLPDPAGGRLLLSALPLEGELAERSLAPWDEKELPGPPKGLPTLAASLWPDGQDLPGARLMTPWGGGDRLWFPSRDRLWVQSGSTWTLWGLSGGLWHRLATGSGWISAHPPRHMGRVAAVAETESPRSTSPLDRAEWRAAAAEEAPWPAPDPAWVWTEDGGVLSAWDQWREPPQPWPAERQREALARAYRSDWITTSKLRASVRGWLPNGAEVVLREAQEAGWAWVGDRILLVRLQPSERHRRVRRALHG